MGHAGGGTADPNTLRIRVPLVVPPLQVRATHLSPTSLTYNAALQHFVRIDRATRVAGDAGYVRILVGDLNSPGLRVRQQGAWHRDHPTGGRHTASTERLERWLAEVNGDATRPSAVVTSGTGPRWLTRFRADHRFSELGCVIMSARAAECCTSCATENGGGALAAPRWISDHLAVVTTLRARLPRATVAGGGAASFAPLQTWRADWTRGTPSKRAARDASFRAAVAPRGALLFILFY
jgi:hypothetical protein